MVSLRTIPSVVKYKDFLLVAILDQDGGLVEQYAFPYVLYGEAFLLPSPTKRGIDMKVGIIGAGSVGSAIGVLLQAKGNSIVGVSSRSEASALSLARRLGVKVFPPEKIAYHADILLLTVNDSSIAEVVDDLTKKKAFKLGQVVIHFSGSLPAEIMASVRNFGAHIVSIHPLQSCAGVEVAIKNLPQSVFSIEGDQQAFRVAERLVRDLEGCFFYIDGKDKMLYHAAAVMISNFTVTMADITKRILQGLSVPPELAMRGMLTLLKGTVANIEAFGTPQALTGPIARGDTNVVSQHIAKLHDSMPELVTVYKEMAFQTLEVAIAKENLSVIQQQALLGAIREED